MSDAQMAEWKERNKHSAARHEAAHATVNLAFGGRGRVMITPNESPAAGLEERFWIGKHTFVGRPRMLGTDEVLTLLESRGQAFTPGESVEIDPADLYVGPPPPSLTVIQRGAVGLAGAVAEYMASESMEADPAEVVVNDFWEFWVMGIVMFSDTDAAMFPDGEEERMESLRLAVVTLMENKALLDRLTAELVEHEYLSDADLDAIADGFRRTTPSP